MNTTLAKLLKSGKIGRLCKSGAWLIAIIAVVQIVIQLYTYGSLYVRLLHESDQYTTFYNPLYALVLPNFFSLLQSIAGTIFYCIVLYVAGTIINALFMEVKSDVTFEPLDEGHETHESVDDDEDIQIVPLRDHSSARIR